MARQNRVTPFGELIATPHRGTLMGNRGCLHDAAQQIRRAFGVKRWIVCVLQFKGRRRRLMTPGRYTELFFLDEATALAAGHRPCAECQRERFRLFREHWAATHAGAGAPSADGIDEALHAERLDGRAKRTYRERLARLPTGVMVADDAGGACLVLAGALRPWAPAGYGPPLTTAGAATMRVLTPPSIVRALARGYPVGLHASARG
jgi:hypothetical protein